MTGGTKTAGSRHISGARNARALTSPYRANRVSGHAANFATGVFIGAVFVLFVFLMID
jgi:hypothetical protein